MGELWNAPVVGEAESGTLEPRFRANPLKVFAKQGRDVSWITIVAKSNEMPAINESGKGADAFLIGCGDKQQAARNEQPVEFAKNGSGILNMLNYFR